MNTPSVDLDLSKAEAAPWNHGVDTDALMHDMLSVADRAACCQMICEKVASAAEIETVALYRNRARDTKLLWLEGVSAHRGEGDYVALETLRVDELAVAHSPPRRIVFPVMLEKSLLGALWLVVPRQLLCEEHEAIRRIASALAMALDRWRLSDEVAELTALVKHCEDGVGLFVHEAKQILTSITLDTGCLMRVLAKERGRQERRATTGASRRDKRLEQSELRLAGCVHDLAALVAKTRSIG